MLSIDISNLYVSITAEPLSQEAFAPFGDVIDNPRPRIHPSSFNSQASSLPDNAEAANQGSAIKYRDVSQIRNLYHHAPSGKGHPKMSIFVCAARQLIRCDNDTSCDFEGELAVRILERHPFTTQTFTPLLSSASSYLVIVAPSLPPGPLDRDLPVPEKEDVGDGVLPGRGLPDVRGLRAFVATAGQAVTYGAGTWHAPMVVLGESGTMLDFVVYQFVSGQSIEDCQLVEFQSASPSSSSSANVGVRIRVPRQQRRMQKL